MTSTTLNDTQSIRNRHLIGDLYTPLTLKENTSKDADVICNICGGYMKAITVFTHQDKCMNNHPLMDLVRCRYNGIHVLLRNEIIAHELSCPDKIGNEAIEIGNESDAGEQESASSAISRPIRNTQTSTISEGSSGILTDSRRPLIRPSIPGRGRGISISTQPATIRCNASRGGRGRGIIQK